MVWISLTRSKLFIQINEPNPDSTYTLDVGDVLAIQLVGQKEYEDNFPINRNGAVNLPDIGMIVLAGLSQTSRSLNTNKDRASIYWNRGVCKSWQN